MDERWEEIAVTHAWRVYDSRMQYREGAVFVKWDGGVFSAPSSHADRFNVARVVLADTLSAAARHGLLPV